MPARTSIGSKMSSFMPQTFRVGVRVDPFALSHARERLEPAPEDEIDQLERIALDAVNRERAPQERLLEPVRLDHRELARKHRDLFAHPQA